MSANGRLKASELTTVQPGIRLAKNTAARFLLLKAAAKKELGRTISIAQPGGGYRDWDDQDEMRRGSLGNVALARKWNLNPHSSVPLAGAGSSSHGFGTRVDIVGTAIDAAFIKLAHRFGFVLEFPGRDPNHFEDEGTYKLSTVQKVIAKVAPKKVYVTVRSGDTLSAIAKKHGLSLSKLLLLNPAIKNPDRIAIGAKIRVA